MARAVECLRRATVALAGAALLTGCVPTPDGTPPPIDVAPGLRAEYVVAHGKQPYALACAPDGRVFYTEKNTGHVRVIKDGVLLADPFASVPVNFADDRGLLGIALHPRFEHNGRVYIFYTRSDTGLSTADPRAIVDHRIVYFEAQPGRDLAEIFVAALPAGLDTRRIGGRIGFAPDRTLYVGFGDTTDQDAAQVDFLPFGKVLRFNDDGTIPADNPTADSPVYARGLCEPRGLAFDPQTGVAFVNERNAAGISEINRILAGKNYGWPIVVGVADTSEERDFAAQNPDYMDPILESDRDTFAGLAFNPSTKYGLAPRLQLFYGLTRRGQVIRVELSPDRTVAGQTHTFARNLPAPSRDLAFTLAGTLYCVQDDDILRVVPIE